MYDFPTTKVVDMIAATWIENAHTTPPVTANKAHQTLSTLRAMLQGQIHLFYD